MPTFAPPNSVNNKSCATQLLYLVLSHELLRIASNAHRSSATRHHRPNRQHAPQSDYSGSKIQCPILCRCSLYCDVGLQTATHTCINRLRSPLATPPTYATTTVSTPHHSSSSPSSGSYPALLRVMYHHPTLSAATRRTIPTPERVSTSQPHLRASKSARIHAHKHEGIG